ncbi:MAG: 4Fe-4S dicluster domain-containing protein [Thermoanaerobaculia bacterium]|nr:4Fe-4S dicluster domain-containing protein [Thermoanaerobaculia bacterium]
MSKGILYDATLCIGCLLCEGACAEQNGLPYDKQHADLKKQTATKFTYVAVHADEKYMRRLCMHCADPTCVSVCPVKALEKSKDGPVVYDASKCMGCRYCMVACPWGVPKYEWSKAVPTVKKCTMCVDRLAAGKQTACSEVCPTGATITGERDELLFEAQKRIRENPTQYVNHIYGEKEAGGTSTLMLSSVPFEQFGLRTFGPESLPKITGKALSHVPEVVTVGWALLGGVYWITNRRDDVTDSEKKDQEK